MAISPSRLNEHQSTLVLDASVTINLLGSARPADILRALGRRIVIEDLALKEVEVDPSNGQPGHITLDALRVQGLLSCERLTAKGYEVFLELTGAPSPGDLGDGEAATIAHAEDVSGIAVIDEHKATRIASRRPSKLTVISTLDLLSSESLRISVGRNELADMVFAALQNARMRVAANFLPWVIEVIGRDRAELCPSMKNYFSPRRK